MVKSLKSGKKSPTGGKSGRKSPSKGKGKKGKAKAPKEPVVPEEVFEPYEGQCIVQGFDEAMVAEALKASKPKKKKGGKKGGKKKKEIKPAAELAGSLALNRNGVGVRLSVPKGAVDKTVTLGALCREFDWVVDKQNFSKEVRIVSSVLEVAADPPYTLFVQPITVQLSHQCATWEKGTLSVVMLQDTDTSLYSEEDVQKQPEYKEVKGATFDSNVATVKIERMGKLMVVDQDIEGSDLVYAMLEVPDAGQNNLSFKMPVGDAIHGKLMLFPKCSIFRPREAYGPFTIAHGTILGSIVMEVEENERREATPMPYLASPFHLSLVMSQPREEVQPGPKRIGDPTSALVGEERDVVLHPSNLGIAEKDGIQQKSQPSSEAQNWKWHGDPLSIPFKLRASTAGQFKSQAKCTVTISLRDLDLEPILVMPQRIHVEIINTYVKVAVRVGMHLDLFVPISGEDMTLRHIRRALNLRLLGWPLSKAKFSPQAGTPFNDWIHEEKIMAAECKPRVFMWGRPLQQLKPSGAVELLCVEAAEKCARKLAFALEQRGCPVKFRVLGASGEPRQFVLTEKALQNDEDRSEEERRKKICCYDAAETESLPRKLLIPLIGPALQTSKACQDELTAARNRGEAILAAQCKELLPQDLLVWKPWTGGWLEQLTKTSTTVSVPELWDDHVRRMQEFPHDELEDGLDAIAAEAGPLCFPECPVTAAPASPEPAVEESATSDLDFGATAGISGIVAPIVADASAPESVESQSVEPV